jgi:hypothetical protein
MHVFGASGFGVSYPSSGLESFWFAIWRYVDMIHVKNEDLIDDTYFPTYFTFFMFFCFQVYFAGTAFWSLVPQFFAIIICGVSFFVSTKERGRLADRRRGSTDTCFYLRTTRLKLGERSL